MIINSIHLKNYRNHSDRKIEFAPGLNLLLGKNGSGKSSFLEAFGHTMFGKGLREGNDNNDIIKTGETNAIVIIDFKGNDGIDYILEKKYPKGSPVLKIKGESGARFSSKDIKRKIEDLCGISKNSDSIFRNVVSAFQNDLTGIFSDTPTERNKVFNAIFDTSLYETMWKNYFSESQKKYEQKISECQAFIEQLSAKLVDKNELQSKIDALNTLLNKLSDEASVLKQEHAEFSKEAAELLALKNEIITLEREISGKNELLISQKSELKRVEIELEAAIAAKEIVITKKSSFEDYTDKSEQLKKNNEQIKKFENYRKQYDKIQSKVVESDKAIIKLEAEISAIIADISEKTNSLSAFTKQFEDLDSEISNISNKHILQSEAFNEVEKILKQLSAQSEKSNDLQKQIDGINLIISDKQNNLANTDEINADIAKNQENLEQIIKKIEVRDKLIKEIDLISERIADQQSAAEQLSTAQCPILKDKCMNVSENHLSIDDYFGKRIDLLSEQKSLLNERIEEYAGIDNQKNEVLDAISGLRNKIENNIKNESEIAEKMSQIKLFEAELKIIRLETDKIILSSSNIIDNQISDPSEFSSKIAEVHNNLSKEIFSLENILSEKRKQSSSLAATINELNTAINNLSEKKSNSEQSAELERVKLKEYQDDSAALESKFAGMETLKNDTEALSEQLATLKADYEDYIQNLNISQNIDKYYTSKSEISNSILSTEAAQEIVNKELSAKQIGFQPKKLAFLENEIKSKNEKIIAIDEQMKSNKYELGTLDNVLKVNQSNEMEIIQWQQASEKSQKKANLSKYFRDNIRNMGMKVAERFVKEIELIATDNYRKISGSHEQLHWSSQDSYQVYLIDETSPNKQRRFDLLSGGEQVSVALALRAAMASTLTKAKFAIFDEPTVNLDTDRRAALAESLSYMLNDLDQAIIVTHDNTFQEIADNTIELK